MACAIEYFISRRNQAEGGREGGRGEKGEKAKGEKAKGERRKGLL